MKAKERQSRETRLWSLQRGVPLVGVVVLLALGAVIAVLVYGVMHHILYEQYNTRLSQAVTCVEHNADADEHPLRALFSLADERMYEAKRARITD